MPPTTGSGPAANFTLTTAAYAQQTLVATDLMLRSMLDWIADEDITSEAQFTDVMKQRRFHEAMRDRLSACLRSALPRSSARKGHLLSSSSDWPAPSISIGQRESFLAQSARRPADFDQPSPARLEHQALELLFVAQNQIQSRRIARRRRCRHRSDYFSNLFRLISLGEDSSVSLFRLDGALLATTLAGPDLMGKTYQDAQPVRMVREGLSGAARSSREPRVVAAFGVAQAASSPRVRSKVFPFLVA